jgi:hypothetical protein
VFELYLVIKYIIIKYIIIFNFFNKMNGQKKSIMIIKKRNEYPIISVKAWTNTLVVRSSGTKLSWMVLLQQLLVTMLLYRCTW